MDRAIDQLATNPRRPGKAIKAIEGRQDRFLRLCVGDHRIMYEIDDAHQVVLIEGIVARKDFDKWLRSR
jgi:mRNA-degrading endonuclease RelE of RelBE toxin-antitoxin system